MKTFVSLISCLSLMLIWRSSNADDQVPGITVEAERQRQQLHHDVDLFVADAVVLPHSDDQTIERWTYKPICPTVAGLTQVQGEFLLARISEIARRAGAPLASATCKQPNLFVIVTSDPDALIQTLKKHPATFNHEASGSRLAALEKPRPVRTWYNAGTVSIDGTLVIEMLDTSSSRAQKWGGARGSEPVQNFMPSQYGSRLRASTVTHDILSVIEIVDRKATLGLTMGQLADYAAVVGLAQMDLDKDLGNAPSILNVFKTADGTRPSGATAWDLALLRALYSVNRSGKMAISDLQGMVFTALSASPPR